jgi:predicted MFS family arabinose efflux permease
VRRLLLLACSIVLVETTFFTALSPLLPQYADDLDLTKTRSGILVAMYAAGGLVAALPSGWLATHFGVRPTVLLGLGVLSATSVLFGFAHSEWALDAARFGQGVAAAFAWTGALAWLVAASPPRRRGELIGVAMGASVGGALLGPALGGLATAVGTEALFSAVAAVTAALAVWAAATPAFAPPQDRPPLSSLVAAVRHREVAAGLWFLALPSILFGLLGTLAPLRLDELGLSEAAIAAVFLIAAGAEAIASPYVGRWSDRRGRMAPVRVALLASMAFAVALPWPGSEWVAAALVGLASVAFGTFFVPGTALLSDGAETSGIGQGYGFALLSLGWAPGHIVGAGAGGAIAEVLGDAGPYLLLAGLCLVTLVAVERGPLAVVGAGARA